MIATAALLLLLTEPTAAAADVIAAKTTAGFVNNSGRHCNINHRSPLMTPKRRQHHRSSGVSTIITSSLSSSPPSLYVNMPPYGTIRKFTILSAGSMDNNMMMDDGYYNNINNNVNYRDDRWQKKMKSRMNNVADPIIQDFGTKDEWEASKHGLQMARGGRNNNVAMGAMVNNVGDDMIQVNDYERDVMLEEEEERRQRQRQQQMMVAQEEEEEERKRQMLFDGEGGNFWMNPMNRMDRYPSPQPPPPQMNGRRRRRRRRRNNRNDDDDGDWWETKRAIDEDFFDDDIDDYYDDDEEEYEYGIPPPSRSRSSFRSGGPSPPRPIKGFYDKLFWFGFDPDVTRPTDRTMFGGTRGKFNALDLLRDREEREQRRRMRDMRRGGRDPVIQDFGDAGADWDVKKFGKGRTGGDLTSDDQTFMENGVRGGMPPPPFPGDMPPMDDMPPPPGMEPDLFDDELMSGNRRRGRRNRRNRRGRRSDSIDGRAAAYDRFIGLGPMDDEEYIMIDEEEDVEFMPGRSRRRRRGYAYKLDDDDFDDDDEYIDIEASYPAEREGMSSPRRGRRSWEERALEMDRVPPRGVAAWGPNGPVSDDVQTMAAMDAMDEIKRAKKFLEKKEEMVEDAKEEVVALKADATFYERQLDGVRGSAARTLEKELGLVLRDVEDSQRMLRMARAERDAASRQVENLEARHWALLSEYEATQSFDD